MLFVHVMTGRVHSVAGAMFAVREKKPGMRTPGFFVCAKG